MNELTELAELRAQIPTRHPDDLSTPRARLLAEIAGERSFPLPARWRRLPGSFRKGAGLAGTVAVAATAAVAITVVSPGTSGLPRRPVPATRSVLTTAYVLRRAAAAADSPQPAPGPGQYIRVHTRATYQVTFNGENQPPRSWLSTTDRTIWLSPTGLRSGVLRSKLIKVSRLPWGGHPLAPPGQPVEWDWLTKLACPGDPPPWGTYQFLLTLPTDPVRLRTWIFQHTDGIRPANDEAWSNIGDFLREMLVPPRLASALFRVAATIPGAVVVRNAVDAAGRHGIAVAHGDGQVRNELIFDYSTYRYLGERDVLIRSAGLVGPAGTVVGATAQLSVSVADRLPHVPASASRSVTPPGVNC